MQRWFLQLSGNAFARPYLLYLFLFLPLWSMAQQQHTFTIKFEKGTLEQALIQLRRVSGTSIAFKREDVRDVAVQASEYKQLTVEQILEALLNGFPFTVEKKGSAYLVKKGKAESKKITRASTVHSTGANAVHGVIIDEQTGDPVPGATVQMGNRSVLSDDEGRFSFSADAGADSVHVSYLGYLSRGVQANAGNDLRITMHVDSGSNYLRSVEVAGVRKSLSDAIQMKQQADHIQDAIVAEDIARFPQSNIAEALQRISGVQITRDYAGGLGNEISIRGLPPEYTQVTINGMAAPTGSDGRTFNFNILPAELFHKAVVVKSPTADMIEGGVAGTVELTTYKPMELKKRILSVAAEGLYNEPSGTTTPRVTVVAGNNWKNKFGVLVNASYGNVRGRSEAFDAVRWTKRSYDVDGDGVKEVNNAWLMDLPRYIIQQQDVDRLSLNTAIQYRFSNNFDVLLDALYVNNKQTEDRYSMIYFFDGGKKPSNVITDNDNIIESIGFETVTLKSENQRQVNDSRHHQLGLTGTWRRKGWKSTLQLGYAGINKESEQFRYYADATGSASYDIRNNNTYWTVSHAADLNKAEDFTMSEARQYIWLNNDKEYSGKLNVQRTFKTGVIKSLLFGGTFRDRAKDKNYYYNRITQIKQPFAPVAATVDGFMDNESTPAPSSFLVHDWDKAHQLYGSTLNAKEAEVTADFYNIHETVTAGYAVSRLQTTIGSGMTLLVNAGAKIAHTSIASRGRELNKQTNTLTPITLRSEYTDLLPSIQTKLTVHPKMLVRAAYAKVITRPSLTDLSAYRVVDELTHSITAKNPALRPFRADQFDIAAEYYFTKSGLLSAGVFYKKIHSFITTETKNISFNDTIYSLTQPVNGNGASIRGFEAGYQQPLSFLPSPFDGLGIAVNYTYANSTYKEVLDNGEKSDYELPNHSKNSYNIIGYYEKYGFSFRVAYNYRSKFLREKPNPADGLKYSDGYGQADGSVAYSFKKHVRISFDVLNIFNAKRYEYIFNTKMMDGIFHFGRTVQFGIRASF